MYNDAIFFICLLISFIGLAGVPLVLLCDVRKEWRKGTVFSSVKGFAINNLVFGIIYSYFYYRDFILKDYNMNLGFRLIDYTICVLLLYFWIRLMGALGSKPFSKKLLTAAGVMTVIRLLFSYLSTTLLMDEAYFIQDERWRMIVITVDVLLVLGFTVMIIIGAVDGIEFNSALLTSGFIVVVSLMVILFDLGQLIVENALYFGQYKFSVWKAGVFDPVIYCMLIINLVVTVFVIYTDFSPLYIATEESPVSSLDIWAESKGLTVLEHFVLKLKYKEYYHQEIEAPERVSPRKVQRCINQILIKFDVSDLSELFGIIEKKHKPEDKDGNCHS